MGGECNNLITIPIIIITYQLKQDFCLMKRYISIEIFSIELLYRSFFSLVINSPTIIIL